MSAVASHGKTASSSASAEPGSGAKPSLTRSPHTVSCGNVSRIWPSTLFSSTGREPMRRRTALRRRPWTASGRRHGGPSPDRTERPTSSPASADAAPHACAAGATSPSRHSARSSSSRLKSRSSVASVQATSPTRGRVNDEKPQSSSSSRRRGRGFTAVTGWAAAPHRSEESGRGRAHG